MALKGIELTKFVQCLNAYCLPHLAEKWDNVGLLVEPSMSKLVQKVMVTVDLTESVMDEAIRHNSDMIISYHPPIFAPLKSLTRRHWKERIIIRALENRIAIYSPHTGLDAKLNSLSDWLLKPFELTDSVCIGSIGQGRKSCMIKCTAVMNQAFGAFVIRANVEICQTHINGNQAEFVCSQSDYDAVNTLAKELDIEILHTSKIERSSEGCGRLGQLKHSVTLSQAIDAYKLLFNQDLLIFALGNKRTLDDCIQTIGVCAGSGGSLLCQNPLAAAADLWVTGEMSHHDRLDAVSRGISLILAGHSVTERGFFQDKFIGDFGRHVLNSCCQDGGQVEMIFSKLDQEPGRYV